METATGDDLSPQQKAVMAFLAASPNGHAAMTSIGWKLVRLGLIRKPTHRQGNPYLATTAIMRALDRRGLVVAFQSGRDQWATRMYGLTKAGRSLAATGTEPRGRP